MKLTVRVNLPLLLALLLACGGLLYHSRVNRAEVEKLHREAMQLVDKAETYAATYRITRVMDGDTFEVDGGLARIRLAGVSVPETWEKGPDGEWRKSAEPDPRGVAAARYMESLTGRRVRLEIVGRDHYGRTLARAYLMPEDRQIGAVLRAEGWNE